MLTRCYLDTECKQRHNIYSCNKHKCRYTSDEMVNVGLARAGNTCFRIKRSKYNNSRLKYYEIINYNN